MTDDLDRILMSKRTYRRRLAALPICEKLRMPDRLRDRSVEIASIRARLLARRDRGSRPEPGG